MMQEGFRLMTRKGDSTVCAEKVSALNLLVICYGVDSLGTATLCWF